MPSEKAPVNNPENIAPLSIEQFKKLKINDSIWVIYVKVPNMHQKNDVSPMTIGNINEDSVQLRQPGKIYPISFNIPDFLNKYKVFRNEKDAEEELKRQGELN
jgi:hypothetical protein